MFLRIRKDASESRCCYDLYIALIEQYPRYLHLGCYFVHQILWAGCMSLEPITSHSAWIYEAGGPIGEFRASEWASCMKRGAHCRISSSCPNYFVHGGLSWQCTRDNRLRIQTLYFKAKFTETQIALHLNLSRNQFQYALAHWLTPQSNSAGIKSS